MGLAPFLQSGKKSVSLREIKHTFAIANRLAPDTSTKASPPSWATNSTPRSTRHVTPKATGPTYYPSQPKVSSPVQTFPATGDSILTHLFL
ncbi:subtilisin-like protease sbt5.3 [Phtheirospermum japonicum]|uniref:Subtilisin-like protease sbt5.3 n=1 Tax=Phtheirospermum japonicum TaxID=374723 RepID=A0A830CTC5_9LAMI|nr:subtilisin-like protease sbt5.3 [Phtheirospermum japonicum]